MYIKKKTGLPSQYKGKKIGKIMRDFDVNFTEALYIHIQDRR